MIRRTFWSAESSEAESFCGGRTLMIIAVAVLLLWTLGCVFACLAAVYPREGS
jgi:hypothetical protein